jgi:AcrR family transcriptional regulator
MSRGRGPGLKSFRKKILAAALDLFASRGYEETTIEDVRAASGASTGSIYHHFKSKQALAAALYLEGVAAYQERMLEVLSEHPDAEDGVRATVRNYLLWVAENPKLARFLLSTPEPDLPDKTIRELEELNSFFLSETAAWRRRHHVMGALRVLPGDLYRAVVIGSAEAFARLWLASATTTELEQAADLLADTAWQAVRPPPARPSRVPTPMPVSAAVRTSSPLDEAAEVADTAWQSARVEDESW